MAQGTVGISLWYLLLSLETQGERLSQNCMNRLQELSSCAAFCKLTFYKKEPSQFRDNASLVGWRRGPPVLMGCSASVAIQAGWWALHGWRYSGLVGTIR